MQYAMQSDGLEKISCFVLKASDSEMLWRNLSGSCMNAVHMAQLAVTQDDPNSQAIAITLKAFYVSAMTDIFGDMPYSEAFRIVGDNITHPKYDEQQDIYASLCDELKTADGLYDTSATYDGAGYDLLYNGDLKKWRKFTNALRLRLLLRQSRQVDVSAEMQEMVSDGVLFENNADGAILRFTGVVPFFNGFGPSGSLTAPAASQNKRMCSRLIGLLDDSGDPRLSKYADPVTVSGQQIYAGMLSGQEDDYINANKSITSNYARALSSDTQPSTFMSYAEQRSFWPKPLRAVISPAMPKRITSRPSGFRNRMVRRYGCRCGRSDARTSPGAIRRYDRANHRAEMGQPLHGGLRGMVRLPPHGLSDTRDRPGLREQECERCSDASHPSVLSDHQSDRQRSAIPCSRRTHGW